MLATSILNVFINGTFIYWNALVGRCVDPLLFYYYTFHLFSWTWFSNELVKLERLHYCVWLKLNILVLAILILIWLMINTSQKVKVVSFCVFFLHIQEKLIVSNYLKVLSIWAFFFWVIFSIFLRAISSYVAEFWNSFPSKH